MVSFFQKFLQDICQDQEVCSTHLGFECSNSTILVFASHSLNSSELYVEITIMKLIMLIWTIVRFNTIKAIEAANSAVQLKRCRKSLRLKERSIHLRCLTRLVGSRLHSSSSPTAAAQIALYS